MTTCTKCGRAIWKPADGGPMNDRYFGDAHMNCADSIEARREHDEALKARVAQHKPAPTQPIFSKVKKHT